MQSLFPTDGGTDSVFNPLHSLYVSIFFLKKN